MAELYDREDLKDAEEKPAGTGGLSTSTTGGKIKYTSGAPKSAEPGELSTSTTPGKAGYTSEIPSEEHSLYSSTATAPGRVRFRNISGNRRNQLIAGGLVAATTAGLSIVFFLALSPLKMLHIVSNLQDHFFATTDSAVSKEAEILESNYLKKYVLPGITKCRGTIDKTCTPKSVTGNGLVSQLYKGWSTANLENKLATKYGIEFSYNSRVGHYYLKLPETTGDGINVDSFAKSGGNETLDDFLKSSSDPQFKKVSRSEIRLAVKNSFSTETRYKQIVYRFKVGRLLEQKYGIKRCIVACTLTDNFSEWKNEKKNAAKALVAERIIQPRAEMLGTVLQCLLDKNCDPTKVDTTGQCTPTVDCESHGENDSAVEKDVQSKLNALAAKYGSEDVLALYKELADKGFSQYMIEKIIAAAFGEEAGTLAGESASKALPVVGWINLAAQTVDSVASAGPKLKKLSYVTNTTTMVALYSMYRTYADEIKDPSAPKDAAIVGAFTDSLGSNPSSDMGGSAEAEQTPLYSLLLGDKSGKGSADYKCNNGNPVPANQEVCPETQPGNPSALAATISEIPKKIPFFNLIQGLAKLWDNTIGGIFSSILGLFGNIVNYVLPGLGETVGSAINKVAGPLLQALAQYLVPSIVTDNMGGGRAFDVAAGGADVAANDYAHNGLGGQQLSSQQVAYIRDQQVQEKQMQFNQQSLVARLFDTNSDQSLVTKLAMAMPSGIGGATGSIASIFTNPFKNIPALIPVGHAAAAGSQPDPFAITQYGYPADSPIFNSDPETYWDTNCSTDGTTLDMTKPVNKKYRENFTINPDTEMPENTTTDPCLLIQAAVGGVGALSTPGLLTPDDLSGSSSTSPGQTPNPTPVSGNAQQLAQQILANKNIQLTGRLVLQDVQAATNGQNGTAGAMTSSAILNLIATVGKSHTVQISAIQSGGTGHCNNTPKASCPNDPHYTGDAVDFSVLDGKTLSGRDPGSLTIMTIAFTVLPSGSGFGQSQCGTTPTLPAGDITFQDSCDHLHVQVPQGTP